jgi:predicted metal-dependent phosphoesterase TrpH
MSDGPLVTLDPHVHSEASYDGREPVELILEQAEDIGLDAIAVTDHNAMEGSLEAVELAPSYDVVAIPGVELSTRHGHLLGLGITDMPEPGRPFPESVAAIRDRGGIAIVPHPFQRLRHGVKKRNITDCDAIEVYNSWLLTGVRNRRARTFATRRGFPGVAGSDAHRLETIGRAYTEIGFPAGVTRGEVDATAIIEAIRDGATDVHGRRAAIPRSVGHMMKAGGRRTVYAAQTLPALLFR